jgi:hypothetical protein
MTTTSNSGCPESPSEAFQRELTTLVRDSFAEDAEIEGTWEIVSQSELVPDWRVVIEKTNGAAPPDNGGDFVDE